MKMMKGLVEVALGCLVAMPITAAGAGISFQPPPMACNTGPVTRTYGKTQWQVFSCQDSRSILVVAAPGSPAAPFRFRWSAKADGSYQLTGDGTGSRSAIDAAQAELKRLTPKDIAAIVSATQGEHATGPSK